MSFEKFTDKARKVLVLAQDEARSLHQPYVGTEHILLGLIQEKDGLAAQALDRLNVSYDGVVQAIRQVVTIDEDTDVSGHLSFTPRVKRVLENSLREAMQMGQSYHLHGALAARHRARGRGHGARGAGPPERLRRRRARSAERSRGPIAGLRRARGLRWPGELVGFHAHRVRHRSHQEGPRGQAGSGHRPRVGNRARHADPLAPHRRTTRSFWASPVWAKPPSPRAWRNSSWPTRCPTSCATSASSDAGRVRARGRLEVPR